MLGPHSTTWLATHFQNRLGTAKFSKQKSNQIKSKNNNSPIHKKCGEDAGVVSVLILRQRI